MAQTVLSTSTPYASVSDLFIWHDQEQVSNFVRTGQNPPPSTAEMLDSTSAAGALLVKFGLMASGKVESTCLIGKRYVPADLQALTGASAEFLKKLVCDLWFWYLAQRRQPGTANPQNVAGALEALETLKALRDGEALFSFEESAQAGLPEVIQANPSQLITPNVVLTAQRIFPFAQINTLNGNGGN